MADSATLTDTVTTTFASLKSTLKTQDGIRDAIRERRDLVNPLVTNAQRLLTSLHISSDLSAAAKILLDALVPIGPALKHVEAALPDDKGSYFRYVDLWRPLLQQSTTLVVIHKAVTEKTLINVEDARKVLSGVQLGVEDYLIGVCNAVTELGRLCVRRVIKADYVTPGICFRFATDVYEGFRELNLRNDFLRKRYDGMKYDVKKMEEVMYDLAVRGLVKEQKPTEDVEKGVKRKREGEQPASEVENANGKNKAAKANTDKPEPMQTEAPEAKDAAAAPTAGS